MKLAQKDIALVLVFTAALTSSCVEPFEVDSGEFLSALVIDATITDEMGRQAIYLSNTYGFEEEPEMVSGASVKVIENETNEILFVETNPGEYRSQQEFAAQSGSTYTLKITTGDGSSYSSQSASLPQAVALDSVYADRITSDLGEDGIAIFVDSFDATGNSQNFRYEYQETYKIIAP
ncbi:MAG: DUF4249 domain-containing protein, partial [Allomuricauda sp.]